MTKKYITQCDQSIADKKCLLSHRSKKNLETVVNVLITTRIQASIIIDDIQYITEVSHNIHIPEKQIVLLFLSFNSSHPNFFSNETQLGSFECRITRMS